MFRLLVSLFIRDKDNVSSPAVRALYARLCSFTGIVINLLLFAGKFLAGKLSGSVAILADAFNNLTDAGSSVITLLGFSLASKKPDPDHPYGHGRMEYLTGLALSVVILLTGWELARSSVMKIFHPTETVPSLLSACILLAAIGAKLYMYIYNRATAKKISSEALSATAADSLSDCIATSVVLLSMGISALFPVQVDGYAGLLVSLFILYAGFNSARETVSPLLGKAPEKELVEGIEETVLKHPEICGIHDLMVHDYGPGRVFVSLHAEVPGNGELFALHDVIDCAEQELRERFGCTATIHMDPIDTTSSEVGRMRQEVLELLRVIEPSLSIHDFRMVPGPTHTNLIFDAVIPALFPQTDVQVARRIQELISAQLPGCFAVVQIDRDYTGLLGGK